MYVAHSCKSGFDVNDTLRDAPYGSPPHATPSDATDDFIWTNRSWDPPAPETINRFVAYGCALGIYAGLGSNNTYTELLTFDDAVLADNGGNIQLACGFIVQNSLIVHDSGNGVFRGPHGIGFEGGHAQVVYDGPAQMYKCHLVGYDFPGRDALLKIQEQPPKRKRVGLAMEGRRAAREGCEIQA